MLEYKCPSCGGALHFESDLQKMKCPYCEAELDVEALKAMDEVLDDDIPEEIFWENTAGGQWEGEENALCTYVCNSCGGKIISDSTTAATQCPYCNNNVVLAGRLSGQLKPDCVLPFMLDREDAAAGYKKHLKGKILLPKVFKDENHIREIKGIYVPVWLFDADARASVVYRATRVRHWSDSRYIYTRTSYYRVFRKGGLGFDGVPVDGSSKMDDALMESLEPFDLTKAVDFQTAYLAGYFADKYDVTAEDSVERANHRIKNTVEATFASTVVGYTSVIPISSKVGLSQGKTRYALCPVWVLSTRYKDKDYLFAMNGQTGKFVGNLPLDKGRTLGWWSGLTAAVGLVSYLISLLL